jgi:hypothetical protein
MPGFVRAPAGLRNPAYKVQSKGTKPMSSFDKRAIHSIIPATTVGQPGWFGLNYRPLVPTAFTSGLINAVHERNGIDNATKK